jgi:hypothetical protein
MYAQFAWYEWVHYKDSGSDPKLARWIGVAEDYGSGNCHWLLTRKGKAIVRSTVWAITEDDANLHQMKSQMVDFNKDVGAKIGESIPDEDL